MTGKSCAIATFALTKNKKMKKNIIIYGLIAGIVVSILMLSSVNYLSHCEGNVDYDTSKLIGYASMLIAFSLVFVGIRNYRDKYNEGVISFGKAFKIGIMTYMEILPVGLIVTLISSLILKRKTIK